MALCPSPASLAQASRDLPSHVLKCLHASVGALLPPSLTNLSRKNCAPCMLAEGVAKVVQNGAGCSKFSVGQRVVAVPWPQFAAEGGSWTTHVCVKEDVLVSLSGKLLPPCHRSCVILNPTSDPCRWPCLMACQTRPQHSSL
jgi:hypothetical protein